VKKLVQDIEVGQIGLPNIQRPFVWPTIKVRDLLDSMYKAIPLVICFSGKMVLAETTELLEWIKAGES